MSWLNWMDLVLVVSLFFGLTMGFQQGLVRQVIGLAALYIGAILAVQFYRPISEWMHDQLPTTPGTILQGLAFFFILMAAMALLNALGWDAYSSTHIKLFPLLDRFGGAFVGTFNSAVMLALVLLPLSYAVHAESWNTIEGTRMLFQGGLDGSFMSHLFSEFTPALLTTVRPFLPAGLPMIFNL